MFTTKAFGVEPGPPIASQASLPAAAQEKRL